MADEGISIRFVRDWDLASEEPPSFDHIPTETGREASRRLWESAFGKPQGQHVNRFDVLYGFATIRPSLSVKIIVE